MRLASYEFGGPLGVTAMMIGFPILMYYLWICLVFYDGQLVRPKSIDDVKPFLSRMWEHVSVVSGARVLLSPKAYPKLGCESKFVRLESVLRVFLFPTFHRILYARISTRGSPSPLTRIQNAHVQLQCTFVLVRDHDHGRSSPHYADLPTHFDH